VSALDRPLAVTFFFSAGAWQKKEEKLSLRALEPRIRTVTRKQKARLPWLKLAAFGNERLPHPDNPPDRWSLRHNANVLAISGVEADYDQGKIAVEEAADVLRAALLAGMIYTSPSHTEDAPRWRVLCPLSQDHAPEARAGLVAKLHSLFDGILSRESFTLSQSYYYGSLDSNPSHKVRLIDGEYLDAKSGLAQLFFKESAPNGIHPDFAGGVHVESNRRPHGSKFIEAVIANAVGKVRAAADGQKHYTVRDQAILLGGYSSEGKYDKAEAIEWLMDALPATAKDRKAARKTAIWGFDEGLAKPLKIPALPPRSNGHVTHIRPNGHDEPSPNPLVEQATDGNVVQLKPKKPKRIPTDWRADWHYSETGPPLPNLFNAMVALRHCPDLADALRYDDMARAMVLSRAVPGSDVEDPVPRPLRDADVLAIQEAMQVLGLRRIAKGTIQDAVQLRASECSFHPVRDYLDALVWDGEKRIFGWLGRYLGVEGDAYPDTIGRLFLIAMVARIYVPGCKSDYMLILEGPQGALKSTACRVLAGNWFSDNLPNISHGDSVRVSMHLRGKWLIEIGELASFASKSGTEALKAFLTQTEERYTPKYAHNEVFEARQCLFIGSTNERVYLRDATGGRRFWPARVGEIKIDALRADRDQLLAEAVCAFKEGAKWWPEPEFELATIKPQQDARYEVDAWQTEIEAWIKRDSIKSCSTNDVLRYAIGMSAEKFGTHEIRRAAAALFALGWDRNMTKDKRPYEPLPPVTP
jgi:Virulence-associated protein E